MYKSARAILFGVVAFLSASAASALPVCTSSTTYVHQSVVAGEFTTIQAAVNALPHPLTGYSCVYVEDSSTYAEQVTVRNFGTGVSSITIIADSGFTPVVSPPANSTAAFQIVQASVNVVGVNIKPTNAMTYGVVASSAYVTLSTVNVQDAGGKISLAGVFLSSWNAVSYSSVTVNAAHAFYLPGSTATTISYSSAQVNSASFYPLYLNGASSNTFTIFFASNSSGDSGRLTASAVKNTISLSTFASGGLTNGLYISGTSNTVTQSVMLNSNSWALLLDGGATFNTISYSTITGARGNFGSAYLINASSNLITQSYLTNPNAAGIALEIDSGGNYNTVSWCTLAVNGTAAAGQIFGGDYNLVTQSFVSNYNGTGNGLEFQNGSLFNTVSLSTMSGGATSGRGLYINNSSSNTATQNYVYGLQIAAKLTTSASYNTLSLSTFAAPVSANDDVVFIDQSSSYNLLDQIFVSSGVIGLDIEHGSNFNTVSKSTITSAGWTAVYLTASSNTFTQSYFYAFRPAANGNVFYLDNPGAFWNTVSYSTIASNSSGSAVIAFNAFYNTFANDIINNTAGDAVDWKTGSTYNTISFSTMVAVGVNNESVWFTGNATANVITQSYMNNVGGYAVWMDNGSGLNTISLSTMTSSIATSNNTVDIRSSTNSILNSWVIAQLQGRALFIESTGNYNLVSGSTLTNPSTSANSTIRIDSNYNTITLSSATSDASANAVQFNGSYNSVTQSYFSASASDGVNFSGTYNTVSQSTLTTVGTNGAAAWFAAGATNTVTGSYMFSAKGAGVYASAGAYGNTVQQSTVASIASGTPAMDIYSSSNTFSQNNVYGQIHRAIFLEAGSNYNLVTGSTFTTSASNTGFSIVRVAGNYNTVSNSSITTVGAAGSYAMYLLQGASSNTVTSNVISSSHDIGLLIDLKANGNTISNSTITAGGAGAYVALDVYSSCNTVSQSVLIGPAQRALQTEVGASYNLFTQDIFTNVPNSGSSSIYIQSGYNTISQSSVTTINSGSSGINISGASNTVTQSIISNVNGYAAYVPSATGGYNTLTRSTFTSNSTYAAVRFSDAHNVLSYSVASNPTGDSVEAYSAYNTISYSSITTGAGSTYVALTAGSSTTVMNSFIGAPKYALYLWSSTGTVVGGSTMAAAGDTGYALWSDGGSGNLTVSSSVIAGGAAAGRGVYIDAWPNGDLNFSSNVISGGQYAVYVGSAAANTRVWFTANVINPTSNNWFATNYGILLNGLTTGATIQNNSIYFKTQGNNTGSTTYGVQLKSSWAWLDHNRINEPGMVVAGSYQALSLLGASYSSVTYNDFFSSGTSLQNYYTIQAVNSPGLILRNNVFASSITVTQSSQTVELDANSQTGFYANYNDYFSSNTLGFHWGASEYTTLAAWHTGASMDGGSISANPLWASTIAGSEDFHPLSTTGRWTAGGFVADNAASSGIDGADISDAYANEPSPNGSRANLGSYGNTSQASETPPVPPVISTPTSPTATGLTVNWTTNGNQATVSYRVQAATEPTFTTISASADSAANATSQALTGLNSNTTYYARAIALVNGTSTFALTSGFPVSSGSVAGVWHFEGDAMDSSGNGNYGTVTNAVSVAGRFGQALSYNGSNAYTSLPTNAFSPNAFTLELWVKLTGWTNYQDIVQAATNGVDANRISLERSNGTSCAGADQLVWVTANAAGTADLLCSKTSLALNTWYFIVASFDSSGNKKLYINGALENSNTVPGSVPTSIASAFNIGYPWNGNASRWLNGVVDEVRISSRVLSANEVQQDMGSWPLPTLVETPTNIVFDEISTGAITAAAYAPTPAFTNLDKGVSGIDIAIGGAYAAYHSPGNIWTSKAAMTTARRGLAASAMGGRLYAIGGYNGSYLNNNEAYDPVANTWSTQAVLPLLAYFPVSVTISTKIYVTGGHNGSIYLNNNSEYDAVANAWTTRTVMTTARYIISQAAAAGGKMYVMGGHNGSFLNNNEVYDPATNAWSTKTALPGTQCCSGVASVNGKVYVIDGNNGSNLNTTLEYNPGSDSWASKAVAPTSRDYLTAAAVGGKIYAIGGTVGSSLNTNEEYDPSANVWTTRAAMITSRESLAAAAIGGKIYVVGGTTDGSTAISANEVYDPGVATSFSGLTPNTLYAFKAKARNQVGTETAETSVISTYTLAAVPGAPPPGTSTFTAVTAWSMTVNWSSGSVAGGYNPLNTTLYQLQLSTMANFTPVWTSSLTYNLYASLTGLINATTYYAQVQAINGNNIASAFVSLSSTSTSLGSTCTSSTTYVRQAGGPGFFTSIQPAVDALKTSPVGEECVYIEDNATYTSSVTVTGFTTTNGSITFRSDILYSAAVNPSAGAAAFLIKSSSVNIYGIAIRPTTTIAYGINATSAAYVNISSVTVDDPAGKITFAGIALSSQSAVTYSSVTVTIAHGFSLAYATQTAVSYSSAQAAGSGANYPLYLNGASSNTFTVFFASATGGDAVFMTNGSNSNTITLSTLTSSNSSGYGLDLWNSSANLVTQSYMFNRVGGGADIGKSNYNTISQSTMSANGDATKALSLDTGASSNTITASFLSNSIGYAVFLGAQFNTISLSTLTTNSSGYRALYFTSAASNTVTQSYIANSAGQGVYMTAASNGNTISLSTVTNAGTDAVIILGSTNTLSQDNVFSLDHRAAYVQSGANYNLITASYLNAPGAGTVQFDSGYNTISYSTLTSASGSAPALYVNGSYNTATQSYFYDPSYDAVDIFANFNTISFSTLVANGSSGMDGIWITAASSNVVTNSYLTSQQGRALHLASNASYNTITRSTITINNPNTEAVHFQGASYNLLDLSVAIGQGGGSQNGVYMTGASNYNTISRSSITSDGPTGTFDVVGGSSNTITQDFIINTNAGGTGVLLYDAANTITLSTVTSVSAGIDVYSGSNTVSNSYVFSTNQRAVRLESGANYNVISGSVLDNSVASVNSPLRIDSNYNTVSQSSAIAFGTAITMYLNTGSSSNTVTSSYFFASGNDAFDILAGANNNVISGSTMVALGAGFRGLSLAQVGACTVVNSYIQGSTAVYISGSTGTIIGGSVLVATNTAGSALQMDGGSVGLTLSSSVLTAPTAGAGVYLGPGGTGPIILSTNTISGAYGVLAATPTAGSQVWITSNTILPAISAAQNTYGLYLNGLTSGATIQNNGIYYRTSGTMSPFASYGLYAQSVSGLAIDHNRIDDPGMITGGGFYGAMFVNATQSSFKFNDVNSTGTSLTYDYEFWLSSASSNFVLKNNVFVASVTLTGAASSSATVKVDAGSQATFFSDYNDFYSSNTLSFLWGATALQGLAAWQAASGDDAHSIAANPLWAGAGVGVEDFHPRSTVGRWNTATQSFQTDGADSLTTDSGDPAETLGGPLGTEQAPNGGVVNQGSYGDTAEASESLSTVAGCAIQRTVGQTAGPYTTIQSAVNSLPSSWSGEACVEIRDSATYVEQVTVRNFTMSASSLTIEAMPGQAPIVSPPAASTAAFQIALASVSVNGINVRPTNAMPYGVLTSSGYVAISSVNVQDAGGKIYTAGIAVSSWNTVGYSSVTVTAAHGFFLPGSTMTTVSYSSAQVNSTAFFALYLASAAANQFNVFMASNPAGHAVYLDARSNYNTISGSSITSSGLNFYALYLNSGSSNSITTSYISNSTGSGVGLSASASLNTISVSSVVIAGGNAVYAAYLGGASSNTLTQDYFKSALGAGVYLDYVSGGANYNTISLSTMSNNGSVNFPLSINGSSNVVTQSVINNANGIALDIEMRGKNAISLSSITSVSGNALYMWNAASNSVTGSFISGANGFVLQTNSNYNTISFSTITNTSGPSKVGSVSSFAGTGVASNTVTQCYVQGAAGIAVDGSTGTTIGASQIAVTAAAGDALDLLSGSLGLALTSSTLVGGTQGAGVYLQANNSGLIIVSSNIISGAQYGVEVATQNAGAQVWITSNTILPTISAARNTYGLYLNGLTSGATIQNNGIYYRTSGTMSPFASYALYAQSASGLAIDHNRIDDPGMITGGGFFGAMFVNATQSSFKFNDVNSTGTSLTYDYEFWLSSASSNFVLKNNVFVASVTLTGAAASSATVKVDAGSQATFFSDYNDFYSSNTLSFLWGASASQSLAAWQSASGGDAHSISANPLWTGAGVNAEDFHPRSTVGRWNPVTQSFTADAADSPTTDAGDPAETLGGSLGTEHAPNGGIVNQGSYGNTSEASESLPSAAGCAIQKNVSQASGPFFTIQSAVNSLPASWSGEACVEIRDSATYAEQVTVRNFAMSASSLTIEAISGQTPIVSPPASSTAAFQIAQASVNVFGINIVPANSVTYGVVASSGYVSISSVNVQDAGGRISLAGVALSSWSAVSYSSVTVTSAHGFFLRGSTMTTISYSSAQANSASFYALYLASASANQFNVFLASNASGGGAYLDARSNYNTISRSSMTSSGASSYGLYVNSGSSNAVTTSYISNPIGSAVGLDVSAALNTVSLSTMVGGNTGSSHALYMVGACSNTITQDYISSPLGYGAQLDSINGGANYNTISLSTMTSDDNTYSDTPLEIDGSSNVVSQSVIFNRSGGGATIGNNSKGYNTISFSSITGLGSPGLSITGASFNTVTGSYLAGNSGLQVEWGSNYNTISFSTISNSGGFSLIGNASVYGGSGASTNTVSQCYVQGPQGLSIDGSTGTIIAGSRIVVTSPTGDALDVTGGGFGMTLTSSTLVGGAQAAGVYLMAGSSGTIILSTNTISGAQYGVRVDTQSGSAQVWITSNTILPTISGAQNTYGLYINGLRSGATVQNNAIYYRTPVNNAGKVAYAMYIQSGAGLSIDHNRIDEPGMVSGGSYESIALFGATGSTITYNDVFSSGTGLTNFYHLQVANASTGLIVRNNVFASSVTVTGSSQTVSVDAGSQAGFYANYNDYFSSNTLGFQWGSSAYKTVAAWQSGASQDAVSISSNPLWASTIAGAEDFHPLSAAGRFASGSFVVDNAISPTIDAGDPSDPYANESAQNGSRVNQGSYGNTTEASRSALGPTGVALSGVWLSSAALSYGTVGASSYDVEASTDSLFRGTVTSSGSIAGTFPAPQGLFANTTYYLRAGSLWGTTTVYSQTVVSTATLSKLISGTTTYQINVTSIVVNWVPLPSAPPDASSNSAEGYLLQAATAADFSGAVISSQTTGVSQSTLTISGLAGGTTYYFRVGTLNWNGAVNFATAVSTLMPIQLGVSMTTHSVSLPGLTNMNTTVVISTSIILTNVGNVSETYYLRATSTTVGSPWHIANTQGVDQYSMWTVVNSTQPATIDFLTADQLGDSEASCGASAFTMGNQNCVQVPAGATRMIWVQVATPLATSTNAAQNIQITARAVKDP